MGGTKTMKKKLMSVLLAAAMVASMATGATCTTVSAAEKKTIKFFHLLTLGIQRRQRAQRRKQRVTRSYLTDHLH